ncbi:unnamed protein product [Symbiodinium sp. CCMP2456]|nr:unnamed protein product [Symbiodinium sp. CCMP2456]
MDHDHHHHHDHGTVDVGDSPSDAFCVGSGRVMMSGFQLGIGNTQPCVLFLFPGWVLDNEARYFAGCFGAFIIPVAIVVLQTARDLVVEKAATKEKGTGLLYDAFAAFLFGLQMCLAYFVMLLTMLYEAVLFLCIIAGFMTSFFILRRAKRRNPGAVEKGSIDCTPCCSGTEASQP